jgi:hypothetical protein
VLISGYQCGPVVPGEPLLEHAGFWSNHLLGLCWPASGDVRPAPERFGDDGADTDAMSEILLDAQAWPAFRIPFFDGDWSGPGLVWRGLKRIVVPAARLERRGTAA